MVDVSKELTDIAMPFVKVLRAQVETMGKAAKTSARSVLKALEFLAIVLVPDALELVELYPNHPVHKFLMAKPQFT